jgi:hypothetical protein
MPSIADLGKIGGAGAVGAGIMAAAMAIFQVGGSPQDMIHAMAVSDAVLEMVPTPVTVGAGSAAAKLMAEHDSIPMAVADSIVMAQGVKSGSQLPPMQVQAKDLPQLARRHSVTLMLVDNDLDADTSSVIFSQRMTPESDSGKVSDVTASLQCFENQPIRAVHTEQ